MVELREKNGSAVFVVKAQPRSSKSRVCGLYNGGLKVSLKAAPVDDAANRECCDLFSKVFHIPPSRVHIIAGKSSRTKTVMLDGVTVEAAALAFNAYE
ncbi:DUF167 domain-containing protein [Chlorobium ferrooxidans]|uniref:UPF0235 protein CferDRAFT_2153 n=1 Tax=Chlorobium ferrooxidans DSM 13031 TaxID=377431 RepID=Q0YUE1_9CHLB|nr:DUF167 domain-containing protein [Chlorobium ferrooxidans]EAT60146.1 Protein of unknown function DUF167 [Chlorobium ferrooxidans DSM 13031]